jgi:two-component system phosphate regulon sensor histidine kinase PhoR
MFRTIRWRIVVPYVVLILATISGLLLSLSNLVREAYLDVLEGQLAAQARLIGDDVTSSLTLEEPPEVIDSLARQYAGVLQARVTIIGADGIVLGESDEDRTQMDNHLRRPEVQDALDTGQGRSVRFSRTIGFEMMYVAVPIADDDHVIGISRVALPLHQIEADIGRLHQAFLVAAVLASMLAVFLALFISERTVRPVRELTSVAERLSEGDLSVRLLPTTRDEIAVLTHAFNRMADRLRMMITTLSDERGRLSAVLENMADGTIITDSDGRVRLINPAAARLLDTDMESAMGRSFAEVARDHTIIEVWQQSREGCEERVKPVEAGHGRHSLQVVVTPLWDSDPQSTLVLLQDLTRIRRLETVRRDFLSNISHELRTPLASLKALADTLRDGAMEDPPAAKRFLDRVDVEVDALAQMVGELLELSRIESGQVPFNMAATAVNDVVLPSVERLRPQAERAGLQLDIDLPENLQIKADAERIQQVVTNIVHNAVKFTPPGGQVSVTGCILDVTPEGETVPAVLDPGPVGIPEGKWVLITVQDTGVGIPADDLPRIFERFYKADRARSGGGTGLGLSIAKHIVQAHGGYVWAQSTEGRGSTFYIALPALTPP